MAYLKKPIDFLKIKIEKNKQGIQKQLQDIPKEDVKSNTIDRELEGLRNILISLENLTTDEKRRVFGYLKSRYSTAWPSENY